ncbi:MAG: hypothetical protein EOS81_02935 [Mesorhizobium sp.]|uniref:hypothetical protein n=1 Tax=Mesorhizobium sp. TaxID=1871066 RepID=UPI000FE50D29|nr:MAG: hypothetical protein EOS81_02935 [Mesorhizobium sp.]
MPTEVITPFEFQGTSKTFKVFTWRRNLKEHYTSVTAAKRPHDSCSNDEYRANNSAIASTYAYCQRNHPSNPGQQMPTLP